MSARRILSCILLPAYLSSCVTNWEVQRASPEQVVDEEQPSQIRVTTTDHSEIVLDEPRVSGDTLIGLERDLSSYGSIYAAPDRAAALEIPLADISHVAINKIDAEKSMKLGLGVVGVALLVLLVVGFSQFPGQVTF
ncbi:MAG: hypothetical protein O7E49_11020 [Gemmatimonadetes bacterium]|nr:hypothetical protein [Gemmatimonadota bacterium]